MSKKIMLAVWLVMTTICAAETPQAYRLGEWRFFAIQDAATTMAGDLFSNAAGEKPPAKEYPASVNVFLLQRAGNNILVDAGYGRAASRLLPELQKLGLTPEKITAVFLTHLHPDHIGGLLTADGAKVFPNAAVYVAAAEAAPFSAPASQSASDPLTAAVKKISAVYKVEQFDCRVLKQNGGSLLGAAALDASGHTPGHTIFMIEGKEGNSVCRVYFAGDLVHAVMQFSRPDFCARYDREPSKAVAARIQFSREISGKFQQPETAANCFIAGAHIPYPGVGKITLGEKPDTFAFTPAASLSTVAPAAK